MMPGEYRLYGIPRSFFTSKLENVLRYLGAPYTRVPKMPHDGSDLERRGGSGAIPLLQTPEDWVLADSTPIARLLGERYPARALLPPGPVQRIAALLLEDWFDEWFTRPAMYTRWNFPECVEAVHGSILATSTLGREWFELDDAERERLRPQLEAMAPNAAKMAEAGATLLASSLDTGQDIPEWFGEFLDQLVAHLKQHRFLFGERPSIADFSLSGGFRAHFAHDPWPRRFITERSPSALSYGERCWHADGPDGDWAPDDTLPPTLLTIMEGITAQYGRYLAVNRTAVSDGADHLELDLGHGPRTLIASEYRERCRLDLRDEIQRLLPNARAAVNAAIPNSILDVYLLPPIEPSN